MFFETCCNFSVNSIFILYVFWAIKGGCFGEGGLLYNNLFDLVFLSIGIQLNNRSYIGVVSICGGWFFYFFIIGPINFDLLSLVHIGSRGIFMWVAESERWYMLILLVVDFLPLESMSLTDCVSLFYEAAVLKIISLCIIFITTEHV